MQTYAMAHARRAGEVLYAGAGSGNPAEDIRQAAMLLRKAAGIFTYVAETGEHHLAFPL